MKEGYFLCKNGLKYVVLFQDVYFTVQWDWEKLYAVNDVESKGVYSFHDVLTEYSTDPRIYFNFFCQSLNWST